MRNILGILFIVLGFTILIFGGVSVLIYCIYNLVMNFETMTRGEIFWEIVLIILRDVGTIIVGLLTLGLGYLIKKD